MQTARLQLIAFSVCPIRFAYRFATRDVGRLGNQITKEGTEMTDYLQRWNDVWKKYVDFSRDQDSAHPSRLLVTDVVGTGLPNHLTLLENYYAQVERFKDVARSVKAQPGNAGLQQQLNDLEEKLGAKKPSKSLLLPYSRSIRDALSSLDAIAGHVTARTQLAKTQLGKKLSTAESKLLTRLLNEVKSISGDLNRDVDDYITNTVKTLATIKTNVLPQH
jgi:hypothetical protein